MNKTFNINLGGYAFVIDEDAYETANRYLHALAGHFNGEGADEIMQDIETRMGELVHRKKGNRSIVNKLDILDAIAVLGTPEELKDINFSEDFRRNRKNTSFQLKTGKRLFRDPNDKILGGVCSGLAAYFGIRDVVWVRLAFFLFTWLAGSGLVIYIVLWAIIPPAKTVSDRLEMMGEPTNVNNIARMVKEEIEEFSDKVHETFKKKKRNSGSYTRTGDDKDEIITSGVSFHSFGWKKRSSYDHKDFV